MYSKNSSLWIWLFAVTMNLMALPAYSETTNVEISPSPEPAVVSTASPAPTADATDLNSAASAINTQPYAPEQAAQPVSSVIATVPVAPIVYTKPYSVGFDKINSGDTAWMLSSTALVLLMTIPGLVLFYAGMVRKRNVLSTALQSFAVCCLVSVIWILIGYTIAFTPGATPFLGGFDRLMLSGLGYIKATSQLTVSHLAPTIPESVFVMFQMTFAIITPALIVGAFAERMRFTAMLLFMTLWSIFVYAPVAHWVWEPSGLFASMGVLDFAGGTVVHINAGAAGLVCAYVLGPRVGYGKVPFIPYNLVYTLVGASLLWVGWFGFNAGSALAADGRAGMAMLVTQIAAAMAALTWILIEWIVKSRITMLGFASGAVAGLVAITPASGFVNVGGALAIGIASGALCYLGATSLKRLLGADDALDVFGIHGVGGLVGAVLTGVFADKAISGLDSNVALQAVAAFSTLAYSAIATLIILKLVNLVVDLRVDAEDEHDGLDLTQHAERIM
ncbi:ammonium transporter [Methylotenera sp.]|uniref:ammonium transporter n=1 Tax=Methylotenera sp. TaxID=2051956 RepID=UPI00248A79C7|nr:ammonium transporter [Methylotenera sp.]MDI1298516.1 ammonium transporter [Methylotenera sp.]